MNMFRAFFPYFLTLVFFVVGVPMALRIVAPNGFYGVRTSMTYSNPEVWYDVNQDVGTAMIVSSIVAALAVYGHQRLTSKTGDKKFLTECMLAVGIVMLGMFIS